jgi:hypothetical protein
VIFLTTPDYIFKPQKPQILRATGAAAIAKTLAPGKKFYLHGIRVHLSAAGGAGNLTITMDAITGATYDTVVLTQDMTSVVDLAWIPTHPMIFDAGDELDVAWANASTRTYGLEIIWSPV